MPASPVLILGGGVTGLAAGYVSGAPVYEAQAVPGGLCASYYLGGAARENSFRFEAGGGHWIFPGDPLIDRFLDSLSPLRSYERRSAVYFPERDLFVPFPLQNHLDHLGPALSAQARAEMDRPSSGPPPRTLRDWLEARYGPTLLDLFFGPFHEAYTAGLWTAIAPQDPHKSPAAGSGAASYNNVFRYPSQGLDRVAARLAARCLLRCNSPVVAVHLPARTVHFENGAAAAYGELVSTLPLDRMADLCGLSSPIAPDPSTSVLVLNIGARRGPRCPAHHWLYLPASRSGFFRVGFYSNVDASFVPGSNPDLISLYVERAFPKDARLSSAEETAYSAAVVNELRDWGFIGEVEVLDASWVASAYTWTRSGSAWRGTTLAALASRGVHMVGRYARWTFQGISDSIRDGLVAGSVFRP